VKPLSASRRRLLGLACRGVFATAAGGLCSRVWAQPAADAQLRARPLRGSLSQISGAGGNITVLQGRDSLALVDTGASGSASRLESLFTSSYGGLPADLVFNTHWHEDHTGGNDAFGAAGARIVAHENTRLWMSTEYYVDWEHRTYEPRAPKALPNDTFFSSDPQPIIVEHSGESIEYAHLREAHTDGDIYVHFREHNVLAIGGVSAVGEYPAPDYATGGWIGGLIEATEKLIAIADADTIVVPARGPAAGREHLRRQREMLSEMRERVESGMRAGRSVEEMLAAGVTDDFDARWGDNRERFVANVYGGLWWVGRLTNSL
jgi:glyoxylase-like metal-dependent hydrolase (beta-lactamase superfamily II)